MCGTFAEKSAQQKIAAKFRVNVKVWQMTNNQLLWKKEKVSKRTLLVICMYFSPITKPPKILDSVNVEDRFSFYTK